MVLVVKNLPTNVANIRDVGSIPGLGRDSGGRHGNPLQYSCLENTKDRVIWWTTVHRVAEIQIRLKQWIFIHSTIICLVNSSCLGLCGQSTLSPRLREAAGLLLGSLLNAMAWKLSQNCNNPATAGFTSFISHISGKESRSFIT